MATVTLNPAINSISGSVGNLVLYTRNGKTIMRAWIMPPNPRTITQQTNRSRFREAMASWRSLPDEEKDSFNRKGKKQGMTGHNLFISRYMKKNMKEDADSCRSSDKRVHEDGDMQACGPAHTCPSFALREKEAGRMRVTPLHSLYRSVTAPSDVLCSAFSPTTAADFRTGALKSADRKCCLPEHFSAPDEHIMNYWVYYTHQGYRESDKKWSFFE